MKKLTERQSTIIGLISGSLFLFLAVGFGAFGAHGLEKQLSAKLLATFKTGVTYQFYHGFGLLILSQLQMSFNGAVRFSESIYLFIVGIALFSFNCYFYALTEVKTFAMIVPVGGFCFLIGWILFFWKMVTLKRRMD